MYLDLTDKRKSDVWNKSIDLSSCMLECGEGTKEGEEVINIIPDANFDAWIFLKEVVCKEDCKNITAGIPR